MSLPSKLKNFNVFNEGQNYMGKVTEVVLPKLTAKVEEYRAGGMDVPIDIDLGMEKMTCEMTLGGYVVQVLKQFGMLRHDAVGLRFAGALQSEDTDTVIPCEVIMRGRHTEIDFGTAKPGDDTAKKVTSSLSYYKLSINGEEVIEIDAINMVKRIDGKDLMSDVRQALGL